MSDLPYLLYVLINEVINACSEHPSQAYFSSLMKCFLRHLVVMLKCSSAPISPSTFSPILL